MLKRMLLAALIAALSCTASATTLIPVQVLNPAGSTSGQAVVSTGPTTAPTWGSISATALTGIVPVANGGTNAGAASGTALDNITGFSGTGFLTRTGAGTYAFQSATNGITLTNLAQTAANTVLANSTGSTANVAAFSMPSCSTSVSALTWTTSTGFTCNTGLITAATVSSTYAPLASPALTGTPTAPAPSTSTNNTQVATTSFAYNLLASGLAPAKFTTLQATSLAKVFATNTSAQSIPTGTNTTVTGWTTGFDANSNFTASTGLFTAPVTGYYVVHAQLTWGVIAGAGAAGRIMAVVFVNGVATNLQGIAPMSNTTQQFNSVQVSGIVSVTAGQTIALDAFQGSGSSVALLSTTGAVWLSIYQLP